MPLNGDENKTEKKHRMFACAQQNVCFLLADTDVPFKASAIGHLILQALLDFFLLYFFFSLLISR